MLLSLILRVAAFFYFLVKVVSAPLSADLLVVDRSYGFKSFTFTAPCITDSKFHPPYWYASCKDHSNYLLNYRNLDNIPYDDGTSFQESLRGERCYSAIEDYFEKSIPWDVRLPSHSLNDYPEYCELMGIYLRNGFDFEFISMLRMRPDVMSVDLIKRLDEVTSHNGTTSCQGVICCSALYCKNWSYSCVDLFEFSAVVMPRMPSVFLSKIRGCTGLCSFDEGCWSNSIVRLERGSCNASQCNFNHLGNAQMLLEEAVKYNPPFPHYKTLFLRGILFEISHGKERAEIINLLISHLIAEGDAVGAIDAIEYDYNNVFFWEHLLSSEDDFIFANAYYYWRERGLGFSDKLMRARIIERISKL